MVLIGHDHKFAVAESPQIGRVGVLLAVLKSQDLDNVCDLPVANDLERKERNVVSTVLMVITIHTLTYLIMRSLPNIEQFPLSEPHIDVVVVLCCTVCTYL